MAPQTIIGARLFQTSAMLVPIAVSASTLRSRSIGMEKTLIAKANEANRPPTTVPTPRMIHPTGSVSRKTDFVVVGETRNYNWTMMQLGAKFVDQGARFIATNPDTHGPMMHPACGALCAPIERMTGKKPFYVGKPSAWIIRAALNRMEAHSDDTIIIGDNLRTDILAGFQAGLETVLVLSGVSKVADIDRMPFRPNHIFDSVVDIDIV